MSPIAVARQQLLIVEIPLVLNSCPCRLATDSQLTDFKVKATRYASRRVGRSFLASSTIWAQDQIVVTVSCRSVDVGRPF
jgi:hypothetical protein